MAFMVVIGASFAIMGTLLTGLVSRTLCDQRTRQASLSLERLAASAAPFFASARMDDAYALLLDASAELGGRLLVVDASGKVQLDTFALLEGTLTSSPEALQVLSGPDASACAIRPDGEEYAALCAARMEVDGHCVGALLLSAPVTGLRTAIEEMEQQMLRVFGGMAAAAFAAALVIAGIVTRPVTALTAAIRRMGRGDLSARVEVHTSGELQVLADSYNAMAEQIENFDRSRSQFVSNASHELKTPLATMKILLENMIYDPDMPLELRQEFMNDMNHEIDRLTGIVTDLLTLTKADSRDAAPVMTDTDLSDLTEETLHTLIPAVEKAGLTLERSIAPNVHLNADRTKLGQVIYNLVDNAVKYTPAGGTIAVKLLVQGRDAVLEVRDSGIGIPAEDLNHIFDRFYRVDKARSRATGGTGLGLSIVRQMVQLHGGAITVDSTPGQGSSFVVTLPLRREDA